MWTLKQERFAAVQLAVAVAQVGAAFPDRFDFGAEERDPGLERLQDVVVVAGFAIVRGKVIGIAHGFRFTAVRVPP